MSKGVKDICDPYELEHKLFAKEVYANEFEEVRQSSEYYADTSIYSNFKKKKYTEMCIMMETMRAYI